MNAKILSPSLLESTPLLEALTIKCRLSCTNFASLPLAASGCLPRLRALVLRGILIPLTHPLYTNLTDLTLTRFRFSEPNSIQGSLQACTASPTLERLHLNALMFFGPIPSDSVHPSASLFHLPRLQYLQIESMKPVQVTRYILSRLAVPPSARMALDNIFQTGRPMISPRALTSRPIFQSCRPRLLCA
ncbi:hypothetical protein BOTBODRAFT_30685 [Botryobasidium botryosum FD-172 SS1]|uniref:F-box domain-containing protein n=1 Tax=Botryobasidium botryosum (strain FD-172 SS1) TaxID=930990 RepID=A0A067MQ06_BOTB1|nr:hypothetical protein BOTBODRAFT_30685 [Botryobasidium botryosum FD-172 SS1]